MSNFAYKFARAFLLFYCLTPQHILIKCENNQEKEVTMMRRVATVPKVPSINNFPGEFALVRRVKTKVPQDDCGSFWINIDFLLTVASCLDEGRLDYWHVDTVLSDKLFKKILTTTYDVKILPMERSTDGGYSFPQSQNLLIDYSDGKALLHPLYRKGQSTKGMPFFDVAVVKVVVKKNSKIEHEIGTLCHGKWESGIHKEEEQMKGLVAFGVEDTSGHKSRTDTTDTGHTKSNTQKSLGTWGEFQSEFAGNFGVFEGQFVSIDAANQFTINDPDHRPMFTKGNLFYNSSDSTRCIVGIMSFKGHEEGSDYITSTKLNSGSVQMWINHAQDLLMSKKIKMENEGYLSKQTIERELRTNKLDKGRNIQFGGPIKVSKTRKIQQINH